MSYSLSINRYRRGLETCPQAKTSKGGHAIFFYFFRRVRATSMTQSKSRPLLACIGYDFGQEIGFRNPSSGFVTLNLNIFSEPSMIEYS